MALFLSVARQVIVGKRELNHAGHGTRSRLPLGGTISSGGRISWSFHAHATFWTLGIRRQFTLVAYGRDQWRSETR